MIFGGYEMKADESGREHSHRNIQWLTAVILATLLCNCTSQNNRLEISFDGKIYSYVRIEHTIKDIEKEPINTSWIKTDNCIIQYCNEYEDFLGNIISFSEEGYKRISTDLLYESKGSRLQIWLLSAKEFRRLSSASSGAIATGDQGGVAMINVDEHKFDQDAAAVIAHEITHLIFDRISGTSYKIMVSKRQQYARGYHYLSEALAQTEDQYRDSLEKRLFQSFPNRDFMTLAIIDAQKYTEKSHYASIVQMRALIKFIRERWGRETLVDIIRLLGKHGLARAIEKSTNMPIDEFQAEWFDYMRNMHDEYKKNESQRGQ